MLIDNKKNRYVSDGLNIITVWDFIKEYSGKDSGNHGDLDIVTGYFTVYMLSRLADEIPEDTNIRIISSQMVGEDYLKDNIVNLLSDTFDLSSINNIDAVAEKAISFLERPSVDMRAEIPDFCHAKAYLFDSSNPTSNYYITGSSNLTPAGIGIKPVSNVELNMAETCNKGNNEWKELKAWYEDVWKEARTEVPEDADNKKSPKIPVKEYFIRKIKDYFRTYTPEEIYYKILFELFNADLDMDSSIEHRQDMSLLQTSVVWRTLFNYQQKGVISLIKMLRKYNGAILADAVGLGKTFSALAVIKYFETQNYTTLLLCPKKLEQNWTQYLKGAGSLFEDDEFEYQVRFHTDLQNDRLQDAYDVFRLDYLQKRKKLLIVIDESHNLRNEKSGRYKALMDSLVKRLDDNDNRDVKILMLSATPINTGLKDVKGQFNIIGRGVDSAFDNEEFKVESMSNLFADGQKKYTLWCRKEDRTIGGFISMLPQNFFNLTDKLIVARTRTMIEKTLGENLHFPDKEKPLNIYQGVDHFGAYSSTEAIHRAFESLTLTAYQPSKYIPAPNAVDKAAKKRNWMDDLFREEFLVAMMGVLFMKRLESSWFSCKMTVDKVLEAHIHALDKVNRFRQHLASESVDSDADFIDDESDDFAFTRKTNVVRLADMENLDGFEKGLRCDISILQEIQKNFLQFELDLNKGKEKDLKFEELCRILNEKRNAENKKVVVFTVYADTARFLYDGLVERGFKRIAMVTGDEVRTTGSHSTRDYLSVLRSFAPYSKLYRERDWSDLYEKAKLSREKYFDDEKRRWNVPYDVWYALVSEKDASTKALLDDSIDILIATDCLSEGQNLQDADTQVNYDIHWNPVRLIQRFGRIDRIGSPCSVIRCINFWPAKSFEDYLKLEQRVVNRMAIMNLVGAETADINEKYAKMVEDNVLIDKNAERLLRELTENSISDIESQQTLSLKDFSFESFRQDLVEYFEKHKESFQRMPNGIFSGFMLPEEQREELPESLVAVLGYPHREQGGKKPYESIYLMCQPVDNNIPALYKELNRAEVLTFLRRNKMADRYVPEWISAADSDRLDALSAVLKSWLSAQHRSEGRAINNELFTTNKTIKQRPYLGTDLDKKYKSENFDLIAWEYISKN